MTTYSFWCGHDVNKVESLDHLCPVCKTGHLRAIDYGFRIYPTREVTPKPEYFHYTVDDSKR